MGNICDSIGVKVQGITDEAQAYREALANFSVADIRKFGGDLFVDAGIPVAKVAKAFRCGPRQLRLDRQRPRKARPKKTDTPEPP
jgi:hypothetical protein